MRVGLSVMIAFTKRRACPKPNGRLWAIIVVRVLIVGIWPPRAIWIAMRPWRKALVSPILCLRMPAITEARGITLRKPHASMSRAPDMYGDEAMAQSFSLANIVPEDARDNRGPWNQIEQATRKYVARAQGDVFIFTGPVYSANPDTIGERQVAIPSHLYKVVYDATTKRAWVHWHENGPDTKVGPPISYQSFVEKTGLDFLQTVELAPEP